jgi:cytochrome c551/c552
MKQVFKRLGLALIVILIGIQFIPADKSNPPEHGAAAAPGEVQALLRRACFDCHSNETVWPWYSQIAPGSLLIARDVKNGRKEVNFSTWEKYDEKRKARKLKEIAKQVEKGGMPLFYYLPLHPEAKLSPAERELIINWAKQS